MLETQCTANAFHICDSYSELLERIQLAVIRKSEWNIDVLERNIAEGSTDFRDLLVQKGFEMPNIHVQWHHQVMASGDIR